MIVAVSGVNGFVGRHLALELAVHGHSVQGIAIGPPDPTIAPLLSRYVEADLTNEWPDTGADAVVHLAALSAVGPSFAEPQRYIHVNSAPMTNLGELACRRPGVRIVAVSTGAVYANLDSRPLRESDPVLPSSPYAVSKLLMETQVSYYRHRGVDAVVMRPFNHIGPGQRPGFLLPDLISAVQEWASKGTPVTVGNLQTRRDFTDVRDVVRAYRLAVEAREPLPETINVCSGVSVSGRELLHHVVEALGVAMPDTLIDRSRIRASDPLQITGDNGLLRRSLPWTPMIKLPNTIQDALDCHLSPADGRK